MVSHVLDGVFYLRPVFYVAVAFVLFFLLFGRKLAGVVASTLDRRIDMVKRELDEAAKLRQEAEAMLADARRHRSEALTQAEALLASAQRQAASLAITMAEDARLSAARRERTALDRIAAAEKAVITELRTAAIDVATEAAEQVLAATLTQDDDATLIDHAIAGLPGAMRAA